MRTPSYMASAVGLTFPKEPTALATEGHIPEKPVHVRQPIRFQDYVVAILIPPSRTAPHAKIQYGNSEAPRPRPVLRFPRPALRALLRAQHRLLNREDHTFPHPVCWIAPSEKLLKIGQLSTSTIPCASCGPARKPS